MQRAPTHNEIEKQDSYDKSKDTVPQVEPYTPKALLPQRLHVSRKNSNFDEIMEAFKTVQINMPFLEAIKQIPSYPKFLKDLTTI